MTSATGSVQREVLPPPSERYTLLGWLRKNLFSNWLSTILTLIFIPLIYFAGSSLLNWVLNVAEWAVIPANWNLLMRGQYPAEEVWRLWLCIYLLAAVAGLGMGVWGQDFRVATLFAFAIPLLLMLIPWLSSQARLSLFFTAAIAIAFFIIGRFYPQRLNRVAFSALILYFPVTIMIVRGLGANNPILTYVPSNLWGGLLLSLLLAVVGIVFSFPLGVLLALGRQSKLPAIKALSVIYIEFIRGVPLISLLFMAQVMFQFFLPVGFPTIDRILRAMAAITLFSAAYTAENVRGGLQSIPNGQYEASHALGLNTFHTMTRIILPQALVAVIPVLVGQFISLFKDTSLVALVGLFDLLGIARSILANPNWLGTHTEVFVVIALIYWVFNFAMSSASRRLEITLGPNKH
jgi:general L-amino acid transport system permease protein